MMNVEQPRLDEPPGNAVKPGVSQAILTWMREQESALYSAPGEETAWVESEGAGPQIEPSPPLEDAEANDVETVSFLLRAIAGTETAARLLAETKSNNGFHRQPEDPDTGFVFQKSAEDLPRLNESLPENAAEAQSVPIEARAEGALESVSQPISAPPLAAIPDAGPVAMEKAASAGDVEKAESVEDLLRTFRGTEIAQRLIKAGTGNAVEASRQKGADSKAETARDAFRLVADDSQLAPEESAETQADTPAFKLAPEKAARKKKGAAEVGLGERVNVDRPEVVAVNRSKRQKNSRRLTLLALPMGTQPAPAASAEEAETAAVENNLSAKPEFPSGVGALRFPKTKLSAAAETKTTAEPETGPVRAIKQPSPVFVASIFPPAKPLPANLPVFLDSMFPRPYAGAWEQASTVSAAPLSAPPESSSVPAAAGKEIASTAALPGKSDGIGGRVARAELQLKKWIQELFKPRDPRRGERVADPPLIAYHWIVDTPQALKVANISSCGLCLVTDYRWSEGNIVSMTLQRTDLEKDHPDSWIAVDFIVVRWCKEGLAGTFIPAAPGKTDAVAGRAENAADKHALERFVAQLAAGPQA